MKCSFANFALLSALSALIFSSCTSGPEVGDSTELDQPVFGRSRETAFFMSTPSGQVKVRDLATIARVLRRYKTLEAAEKALIALAVRRQIDGLVALEASFTFTPSGTKFMRRSSKGSGPTISA